MCRNCSGTMRYGFLYLSYWWPVTTDGVACLRFDFWSFDYSSALNSRMSEGFCCCVHFCCNYFRMSFNLSSRVPLFFSRSPFRFSSLWLFLKAIRCFRRRNVQFWNIDVLSGLMRFRDSRDCFWWPPLHVRNIHDSYRDPASFFRNFYNSFR